MKNIKIALLGSFPLYPYRYKVKFHNTRKNLVTSWNFNLAKALARIENIEVHFFCNASLFRTKTYNDEGLFIHFVGHPPKLSIINRVSNLQFSKMRYLRMLEKLNPDIVHGIGTDHEYAYIATKSKFPNIITVHGVMKQVVKKLCLPQNHIYQTYAKFEEKAISKAENLVSINPYVSEQFPSYKGNIYNIENPIHQNFFTKETTEIYDIAFVGIYNRRKRLLNLLKAIRIVEKQISDVKLNVIGFCKDSVYDKETKKYVTENKITNNVEFVGQLSQESVVDKLSGAKILVLPSIEETAPMVIAEAMALGKPVIATDVGGIKYMIKDGETGYVIEPDDINELVDKILRLLLDNNLRKKMGNKAKQIARRTYHPDIVAEKTLKAYMEIIKGFNR